MPTPKGGPAREFHTPEESCSRSLFDAFADAFTHPEDLTLHQPDYGFLARVRDARRIREDFRKAIRVEEAMQNSRTNVD